MPSWLRDRSALVGIQWYATADGWLDRAQGPSLNEKLKRCSDLGFAGIRIEVPPDLSARQYAARLAEYNLAPAPGYQSIALNDDGRMNDSVLDEARRTAATHAELGLTGMFVAAGMDKGATRVAGRPAQGHAFDGARLDRVIDAIGTVADVINAEGVRPALHPHVGTWVETEYETRCVLDAIDASRLAFGPDTGHLAWAGGDPALIMREHRERVDHVHLKDMSASVAADSAAAGKNYQETILAGLWREPGLGAVDLDAVLDALGPEFDGWLIVEVDRPFLASAQLSIEACAKWIQDRAAQ
jgi:inosose dehydratase